MEKGYYCNVVNGCDNDSGCNQLYVGETVLDMDRLFGYFATGYYYEYGNIVYTICCVLVGWQKE